VLANNQNLKMARLLAGKLDAFSFKFNELLFIAFTTLWSIIFYFTYWRNGTGLLFIGAAVVIDAIRSSQNWSTECVDWLDRKRPRVVAFICFAFILQSILVLYLETQAVAFGTPYLHYLQARNYTTEYRATIVYVLESACAFAAFILFAYQALLHSSARGALETTRAREKLISERKKDSPTKLLLSFLFFAAVLALAHLIDFREVPAAIPRVYAPGRNIYALIAYSTTPIIFAVTMKYWLIGVSVTRSNIPE
jgi:hypothetical protein